MRTTPRKIWGSLALVVALLGLIGATPRASARAMPTPLVGTFQLGAGACGDGVTGSYFRMILPSGSEDGPYVGNGDSPCSDTTYTPLSPGTDGGLITGGYQPNPDPAFDDNGNALADRITMPASFYGVGFGASTNEVDPQLQVEVPPPSVSADGATLTGNLSSFSAQWNNQVFNQGAPKPDGTEPGLTVAPTGTYDAATGAFVLEWRSLIQGGPFNGFTGVWHLEGTFVPASSTPTTTSSTSTSTSTTTTTVVDRTSSTTAFTLDSTTTTDPSAPTSTEVTEDPSETTTTVGLVPTSTTTTLPGDGRGEADDDLAFDLPGGDDDDSPPLGLVLVAVVTLVGAAGFLVQMLRTSPRAAS